MMPLKGKLKGGPEAIIQAAIVKMMRNYGWFVKETHGNMYQSGFPDMYCTHTRYGHRWIEVKLPDMKGSKFTPAQLEDFPKFCANGDGIWILWSDTDAEYAKLFKPHNWWQYLESWK